MSAARQRGTLLESQARDYIKLWVPDCERRPAQGSKDKGDLFIPGEKRFIIEVKNHKEMKLAMWIEEAKVEADNAGVPYGVVWHKRRGCGIPGEQYVTMPAFVFMGLVYPDGPIER